MARPVQLDWIDQGTLAQPMSRSLGNAGRTFSDKMVVARRRHRCTECEAEIATGERVRARVELDPSAKSVQTLYACAACCEAMADQTVRKEA